MATRRRTDERGQATIEVIGTIPLFMLVLGAIIQLFLIGYAAISAESSARLAARTASQGASETAAENAGRYHAPGIFDATVHVSTSENLSRSGEEPSVDHDPVSDSVSAEATYEVPFLGIGIDGLNLKVTRYVVLPDTD